MEVQVACEIPCLIIAFAIIHLLVRNESLPRQFHPLFLQPHTRYALNNCPALAQHATPQCCLFTDRVHPWDVQRFAPRFHTGSPNQLLGLVRELLLDLLMYFSSFLVCFTARLHLPACMCTWRAQFLRVVHRAYIGKLAIGALVGLLGQYFMNATTNRIVKIDFSGSFLNRQNMFSSKPIQGHD